MCVKFSCVCLHVSVHLEQADILKEQFNQKIKLVKCITVRPSKIYTVDEANPQTIYIINQILS